MRLILIFSTFFLSIKLQGQSDLNNLFIKCDRCDNNFLKNEIKYVNHVREQGLADIQLFIYRNRNANNGNRYSLDFIGKNNFSDKQINLILDTNPKFTSDEVRNALKKKIDIGLIYFLVESDISDKITIKYDTLINNNDSKKLSSDKWKNWVFQSAGSVNFENETSRNESNVRLELDADKITDKIKLQFDIDFDRSISKYESQNNTYLSKRNRKSIQAKSVWSINDKWSAGFNAGASGDTYQNINYRYYFMPAIEYSFFPYYEFVRREMVLNYRIGYGYRNYIEETIYDKFEENVYLHQLAFETRFRQPWGEIYTNLRGKTFLQDPSKNSFSLDSWFSIRVFEGLSLRFGGEIEIIRDQLSLPKGNASIEDLLLQQQEIATDFRSEFRISIGYTFGSAFNNYLNSRL